MNKKPAAQKLFVLLLIFILLGVFLPLSPANAGFLDLAFEGVVSTISGFFVGLVGQAIYWMASLTDSFIKLQTDSGVYKVFVVDQSWTIIRNFVNMFFILVLVIMAFGTIFGMEKYSYRQMLGPFLIAALLVNFSLTIGQYIIAFANGLSNIFLKQTGDLSANFAQGISLVKMATNQGSDFARLAANLGAAPFNIAVNLIFSIVLLVIVFIAFAAILIFSVARLFVLWFLLIISPIAWIGYSFPHLRQRTWGDWWKNFLCWCFFLPYYLFFMLFAIMFIRYKDTAGATGFPELPANISLVGLTANDFMFYALSIIFMVGGLGIAKKLACASGTGVAKVFGAIEGTVSGYVKRTTGYTGLKKGLQAKSEEVLEKGAFGIPGLQAGRIREAKIAERFSFGALRGEQEKQLVKETSDVKEKIKDRAEQDLMGMISKGSLTQQLAARELLREKGALSKEELVKTYDMYRRNSAGQAATKFISSVDFKDLSGEERKFIARHMEQSAPEDLESRRKLVKVMAEKGDFRNNEAGLENAARLFNLEGDKFDIINRARKYGMQMAAGVEARLELVRDEANQVIRDVEAATAKALERSIERANIDTMLELSTGTLKELRTNEKFINKFKNAKFRENFLSRASQGQVEAVQPMLDHIQASQLDEDIPKLEQELANKEALRQQTQQNQQALRTQVIDLQARLTETEAALRQATDQAKRQQLGRQLAELRFDSDQLVERAKELSRRLSQADEDIQKTSQSVDQLRAERARLTQPPA